MPFNPLQECLHGAWCDLAELTGARFAARDLQLRQLRPALNALSGASRSPLRGRGLEFEEVRAYQAGDDIRAIDWRVTARTGRAFTKLFREERERPLLLAVDQRQPMFFGSRTCFKAKLAAWLGALLAWTGLQEGDRIGGLAIGNDRRHEVRPRRSSKSVLAWLNTLHQFNRALSGDSRLSGGAEESLIQALSDLRRTARPGSSIFLISDFSGARHPLAREQLYRLARHCELTALFVYDPLERELPPPGQYTVTDGARRLTLDAGDKNLREHYRQHFDERREALRQQLAALAIPLLEVSTEQPPLAALSRHWGNRR